MVLSANGYAPTHSYEDDQGCTYRQSNRNTVLNATQSLFWSENRHETTSKMITWENREEMLILTSQTKRAQTIDFVHL